ncbi:MAG: hypothetical protein HY053_06970 [Proteobacteria bacterium]|nr:hypothetical protein [Pseudomonadota bacterium]
MRKTLLLVALFLLAAPAPLWAVETVKSPLVEEGLLEFEQKGKLQNDRDPTQNDEKEFEFNAAYGVTQRWKTKVEAVFEQKRSDRFHYKGFKWENIFNLNGKDVQNEVVFGLYQDIFISNYPNNTHNLTFGLLARRDFGKLVNLGNLYVRRDFGDTENSGVRLQYRWMSKYSVQPWAEPGFEVMGDTQQKEKFRNQGLMIGPALYGNLSSLGLKGVSYELGYLIGVTPANRDSTFKWKLKYAVPIGEIFS